MHSQTYSTEVFLLVFSLGLFLTSCTVVSERSSTAQNTQYAAATTAAPALSTHHGDLCHLAMPILAPGYYLERDEAFVWGQQNDSSILVHTSPTNEVMITEFQDNWNSFSSTQTPIRSRIFDVSKEPTRIAYSFGNGGQGGLLVYDLAADSIFQISDEVGLMRWSQTGEKIAYSIVGINEPSKLILHTLGSNSTAEYDVDSFLVYPHSWSLDDRYIAIQLTLVGYKKIGIVDTETGDIRVILDSVASCESEVEWVADRRQIVFQRIFNGRADIYMYDLETNVLSNLTQTDSFDELQPAVDATGNSIVYVEGMVDVESNQVFQELVLYRVNTQERIYISENDEALESRPKWSPDNSALAYATWEFGGQDKFIDLTVIDGLNHSRVARVDGPTSGRE